MLPVTLAVGYALVLLAMSRYEPSDPAGGPMAPVRARAKRVVFVLPCPDEETVLEVSLRRLLGLDEPRVSVLVVTAGPDDQSAEVVNAVRDPRVHLFRRRGAGVGQGRSEALNAAVAHVRAGGVTEVTDPADVVVCVLGADERLDSHALAAVLPLFDDPAVGAVQIGARVEDRDHNLLTRMQDAEMALHAEVFQRGRQHVGGNGLGCEAQFMRLSALSSVGDEPWSSGPCPELNLGLRLMASGWRTEFAGDCAVYRTAPLGLREWLRRRSRRTQGVVQCWQLASEVMASVPGVVTRLRVLLRLSSPVFVLIGSLVGAAFLLWSAALAIAVAVGAVTPSWWWLSAYLLVFVPTLLFGHAYHEASGERPGRLARWRSVLVMHLYIEYLAWWGVAVWWVLLRKLTGRRAHPRPIRAASSARHRKHRRGAWARLAAP